MSNDLSTPKNAEFAVAQRIREFIRLTGMSKNGFATTIGHRNLTKSLHANKAASTKILLAMHHHFPQLNLDWLLTGRGTMIVDTYAQTDSVDRINDSSSIYQAYSINKLVESLSELTQVVKQKLQIIHQI